MITAYSAIIPTTPITIRYPIWFTSSALQQKLIFRRAASRLAFFRITWQQMAPAVAAATVLLTPASDIVFARYRNVTRVVGRGLYGLCGDTTLSSKFIHCQTGICFHNISFLRCSIRSTWEGHSTWVGFCFAKIAHPRFVDQEEITIVSSILSRR